MRIVFSETVITVVMKFTYIMGTSFTKLRLFFHKVLFIINTLFQPLCEVLYTSHIKLFAEASKLFTHAVFQLIVIHKMASLEYMLRGGHKDGSGRVLNLDLWRMGENSPPRCSCLPYVQTGVRSGVVMQGVD
jgi:hypothetical protein